MKDQGSCGSCWAVAAVEAVETAAVLAGGALAPLSVQQVLECDPFANACYGGFPSKALQYIARKPRIREPRVNPRPLRAPLPLLPPLAAASSRC